MNDQLETSFWTMIFLQTLGSVDMPGSGDRKMPAPRAYVAILITWEVLSLSRSVISARAANTAGWVMVLTGMVAGPFGAKLVHFFNRIATTYGGPQVPQGPQEGTKLGPLILGTPFGH